MTTLLALATMKILFLTDIGVEHWQSGFDQTQLNRAVGRGPLLVKGVTYSNGIGTHAHGGASFVLDGDVLSLRGMVAINDTGRKGSVEFSVWGDSKQLWTSGLVRGGSDPVKFDVDLKGVKQLTLVTSDGGSGDAEDHGNWLDTSFTYTGNKPEPTRYKKPLTLLPRETHQTMSNFGASDSWTVEPLIHWSEDKRKEVARLLFDKKTGAGLSGWRHNLGGGLNDVSITMALRQADTYDAGDGKFDFTKVPGQRWMLKAAKDYGVESMLAYAVSPPTRLTRNGLTNCTDGLGTTNLKEGAEGAFAKYLVGAVKHFVDQGYPFKFISPINEPDYEWNGAPNPTTQEGCRASNEDLVKISTALAKEAKSKGLGIKVVTPEATSPYIGYDKNPTISKKYGAEYGDYSSLFADQKEWRKEVAPIYGYHSYFVEKLDNMKSVRTKLGIELKKAGPLEVWMTEFCHLQGPNGEGGRGRDLGMSTALNMARLMQLDITEVGASAWQWWLAVSDADFKDGLVYVDDLYQPNGSVYASKSLWVMGQFARFVRPGYQRISINGPFADVTATLVSAYKNPQTSELVVILVNPATQSDRVQVSVEGKHSAKAWITSDRPGHNIAPLRVPSLASVEVPSRSVITLVLTPKATKNSTEMAVQ